MPRSEPPLLSLVVACYSVARYVPELIASLEAQLTDEVEVVVVDDGSTDATPSILRDWAAATRHRVTVIEQANSGVAAARNAGLDVAAGEWVSFPDGDDVLGPDYLREVTGYLRSRDAQSVRLVAANIVVLDDASGRVAAIHPLRAKFARGRRAIRLADEPNAIQLHTNSAFVRRDDLVTAGHRFDPRIRPSFEDAALLAQVLLDDADPKLAVLPEARYHYRQRSDQSSLVASGWAKAEKYDDELRYGYLPLVDRALAAGKVPAWLQNLLLYELGWFFKKDAENHSETARITPEQTATFFELAAQVLRGVDVEQIPRYGVYPLANEIRTAFVALKGELPERPTVRVWSRDTEQRLTRVTYYSAPGRGSVDGIAFRVDGSLVEPVHAKSRTVRYLGREVLRELIVWLPGTGEVTASLDGEALRVITGSTEGVLRSFSPHGSLLHQLKDAVKVAWGLLRHDRTALLRVLVRADLAVLSKGHGATWVGKVARMLRPRYRDAWLLMDRDDQAHDNAEHLYRYLRQHRPDINAWFVIKRGSQDWERLAAEGFRLVPYGTLEHVLAAAQTRELVSSQIDHYVVSPPVTFWLRPLPWRFTWLQHGVTKDDLSRWVNPKPVSTVLTVTPQETASIVDDGTPYVWTRREVAHTGFPRHDALVAKAAAVPEEARTDVVLMPTWRGNLLDGDGSGNTRTIREGFWESDFVVNWLGLLASPALKEAADAAGLNIVFMPHPNMTPHLDPARLPEYVRLATYEDDDFQDVVAHASHVVTDYSSNAFEAALVNRPVLYFQFDHDEFFNGEHAYRKGYFDYASDGFGPVTQSLAETEQALVTMIRQGRGPAEPYATRIRETFTLPDGRACERVVEAIVAHRNPLDARRDPKNG
ncbi:glycosyl transferase family 2 [Xylanimonas cellulosilytica DSM 15894]|uniref:Glycosyl transferase family 2 n=1 Tax=Xylanimonas cellulosilytica (strain DSM 15894 / JCM 12276 / CECT 5975 / KCTC 9989 / LMG 20990 / NBRC 107835 / XIL07) TaxID=446471 RepID=D1BX30_XYLCX|nr:CDP-glycerol glycerophosphotransferase family protein [Xylanimonas cellulosilytica]ACZ31598.1 glycosyl transferase family 2 [Xylanimonas cellulosilytica DSM 15894]